MDICILSEKELLNLAIECERIIAAARRDLGNDIDGLVDLCADNTSERLADIREALRLLGEIV